MEIKWTPWRMAYINRPKAAGCVLCQAPKENDDRANLIVYRGQRCYVLLNLYPYNTGHLMVVPYAHVDDLTALDPETVCEMMALAQKSIRALRRAYSPQGFNLGINQGRVAGAGIADHLHLHVVPRWEGDMNFMPLLGGTKLIPELLEETWEKVRRAFQEEDGGQETGNREQETENSEQETENRKENRAATVRERSVRTRKQRTVNRKQRTEKRTEPRP